MRAAALCACLAAAACDRAPVPTAIYDEATRRLIRLDSDGDNDAKIEQRVYTDGNQLLRGEMDSDQDGRIDRWEYFGADGEVSVIGTSTLPDGVEDTWTWAVNEQGERRVDLARQRDRRIDRQEFYRGETIVRAQEDATADGRIDRWERYDNGRLREILFDMTDTGRPDRRLVYDAEGRFERLELDPDRDGVFTPAPATTPPPNVNRP